MKIIVDAMGGDNAPDEIITGAVEASKEVDATIVLVGDAKIIKRKLDTLEKRDNIKVKHASEVISNEEIPTKAIKTKKDSSMVVGLNMIKQKEGEVFISAGSTGALLTGALLNVGRIKGISRPALCPTLPSQKGPFVIVDSGANTNCRPDYLVQFAHMGNVYCKNVLGIKNPRIGLLNIGTESEKGNDLTKVTYELLKKEKFNFIGNIEGRDLMPGNVDVVVCDGFTGNAVLKTIEGFGLAVFGILKESLTKSWTRKASALLIKPTLREIKHKMDYTEYGGALLLGIDGGIIKCHGTSKAKEIKSAILQAYEFERTNTIENIKEAIK